MSVTNEDIIATQKFIENASGKAENETQNEEAQNESEKLILDEMINEKLKTDVPEPQEEFTSEDTESSRDEKSVEKDLVDEEGNEDETAQDEWQDILGSGVILKKVIRPGEPDKRPNRSDKCYINYTYRLEEADEEDFIDKVENFQLGLGEGDVVQGLDVAIALMNKNERSLLKIGPRLAFSEKGLPPKIKPNSTVMFDVELLDFQLEDDFDAMTVQERQTMGNKKRERGNWWYLRGEHTLAVQCYRRALDFLEEVETEHLQEKPSDAELQQLLEDRLKVVNNMASAQIKMELYDQALTSLQTVLHCQPDNVKALFRKAKVHIAKNELGQALKLLERAKVLEPEDALITKEITTVSGLINKQKNSEREYARRMFGNSGSNSKTKLDGSKNSKGDNSEKNKIQIWITLGATLMVGIAGVIAYRFKYP